MRNTHIRIGARLGLGFAAVVLMITVVGGAGRAALRRLHGEVEAITEVNTRKLVRGCEMVEIIGANDRVIVPTAEFKTATREQTEGIGQVGVAVRQMDQAKSLNAALVEQSAVAAGEPEPEGAILDGRGFEVPPEGRLEPLWRRLSSQAAAALPSSADRAARSGE